MSKWLLFAVFFVFAGCASKSVRIADVDRSLSDLSRSIRKAFPTGTKRVSRDGKRFQSQYFSIGKNGFQKPEGSLSRYKADVLIRGDRRPYSVDISVSKEKKVKSTTRTLKAYRDEGLAPKVAEMVKSRILKQLSKRREDKDAIDDFRVF